jgi:esterase/lipase superfamily enzyme
MDGDMPAAAPPPAATQPPDQAEYKVWYGTSRKPNDPADSNKGYSAERDNKIHYGTCTVYIPESHKIGSIGSSWWKRLVSFTDDRLKLLSTDEADEASFWTSLASTLDAADIDDRDALIFVHGYNVSFEDAALRAAQIGFDLSIKGAMAFFSWPSRGTLKGYSADEATIGANEPMIAEFMTKFAAQSNARAVHIIAHSMGNRGVLRAVDRIAQQAQRASGVPFGQIILAAADVDADTFRNLCAAYPKLSKRATLYVSQRDLAVEASHWLHDFPRVGLMPPVFVTAGIDTINVTNADLTALGHGYVASARDVLQDMHDLIVHGAPPGKRFGLRAMKTDDGHAYWLIGQ